MGEQIVEMLESFVKDSVALIVNSCLNVCQEIFKFFLILLILYYFTLWLFQILDELSLTLSTTAAMPDLNGNEFKMEDYFITCPVIGETGLRIGAPDEKLIQQRASLLEQLEIEAEFEENIKQQVKSVARPNKIPHNSGPRNSEDIVPLKDMFISQIKRESNETSRPSQTVKTSLGKKSKPKNSLENDQTEDEQFWRSIKIIKEIETDGTRTTSATHETSSSYGQQINHKSFNRV